MKRLRGTRAALAGMCGIGAAAGMLFVVAAPDSPWAAQVMFASVVVLVASSGGLFLVLSTEWLLPLLGGIAIAMYGESSGISPVYQIAVVTLWYGAASVYMLRLPWAVQR